MTIRVFFVAGQSMGAVPNTGPHNLPTHLFYADWSNVYLFGGTYWGGYAPGVNSGAINHPEYFGPPTQFFYEVKQAFPSDTILIVQHVKGETPIQQSSGSDWSPSSSGELFDAMSLKIQAAASAWTAAQGTPFPAATATIFSGMETDAFSGLPTSTHLYNIQNLASAIRAFWMHDPEGDIIMPRISDSVAFPPRGLQVREAQWQADQLDPHLHTYKTLDLTYQYDSIHLDVGGIVGSGSRMFDAAEGWL
jgi:hypothetical protein